MKAFVVNSKDLFDRKKNPNLSLSVRKAYTYKYRQRMFANIYDLLKSNALSNKQNDDWAKLSRKFGKQARRELKKFVCDKNIEWDGNENVIRIGKHFVIGLRIR